MRSLGRQPQRRKKKNGRVLNMARIKSKEKEKDILERIGFAVRVGEKFPTTFPQDQVNKFVELAYELGKKEGRESVIKEIEKLLLPMFADKQDTIFKDDYIVRRKEWEGFKNNPLKESVIIGKEKPDGFKRKELRKNEL